MTDLTAASQALLDYLWADSMDDYADRDPEVMLLDNELTAEQRGNLTDLKGKGLVTLLCEDNDGRRNLTWYSLKRR